jgi:nucleotidyltransferase substrate binding protein (TIGR01987 family)
MAYSKESKVRFLKEQFESALESLRKASTEPNFNEYVQDATIQRFEYTYELAWKYMKALFNYKGVEVAYPRDIFREAFSAGWLIRPDVWEAMIEDRNITSHTYKSRSADRVFNTIQTSYYAELSYLQNKLSEVIDRDLSPK